MSDAGFCFDIAHAHSIDPSMDIASELLNRFRSRLRHVHLSSLSGGHHIPVAADDEALFMEILARCRDVPWISRRRHRSAGPNAWVGRNRWRRIVLDFENFSSEYAYSAGPVEKRWQRILASALDGVVVEPAEGNARPDLTIRMRDVHSIAVEVKWAGEAGQARILGPDGLIVIRELAPPRREERVPRRFNWSPSAIIIAETILARGDQRLRATDLARTGGWSVPQTANVLKAFDRQGWTIKRGTERGPAAHRELIDADAMLGAWSAALADTPRTTRIAHRATRDVMTLLREDVAPALDREVDWAVSGWAGLELAAPFMTTTPSLQIYVADTGFAGPLSNAIQAAGLHEVDEGGRVTFGMSDPRVLKLAARRADVPAVSPPRLYADLSSVGARGQDAADHVKGQLIDPLHHPEPATVEQPDG